MESWQQSLREMKENQSAIKQRARQSKLSVASSSKNRITFRKNEPAYVQTSQRGVSLSVVKFIEKSPHDPRNTRNYSSITDWDHYADVATPPSSSSLPEPPKLWRHQRRPLATSTLNHSQLSSLLPGAPILLDEDDDSLVSGGVEVEDSVADLEYISKIVHDDSGFSFSQSDASFVTCFDDVGSEETSQDFNSAGSDFEVVFESKYQVDEGVGVSTSLTIDENIEKTVIDEDPAIVGYTKMQSIREIEASLCKMLNIR